MALEDPPQLIENTQHTPKEEAQVPENKKSAIFLDTYHETAKIVGPQTSKIPEITRSGPALAGALGGGVAGAVVSTGGATRGIGEGDNIEHTHYTIASVRKFCVFNL